MRRCRCRRRCRRSGSPPTGFGGSGVPAAHLKNTTQALDSDQATAIKDRFVSSVVSGDVFVTGSDWEYNMMGREKASESSFIEAQHATAADMCRFLGVPGDMVDVNEQTGSVTYANITQRNLQLLIINLGPARTRRESAVVDAAAIASVREAEHRCGRVCGWTLRRAPSLNKTASRVDPACTVRGARRG